MKEQEMNLKKALDYLNYLLDKGVEYYKAENMAATKYHVDPIRLMEAFDNTDFVN